MASLDDLHGLDLDGEPADEEPPDLPQSLAGLRERLLNQSAEAPLSYLLGTLLLEDSSGGPAFSCNIIGIAAFESRVVVAVPHSVWHRQAARRILPRAALTKAVAAEVLAAHPENRAQAHQHLRSEYGLGC